MRWKLLFRALWRQHPVFCVLASIGMAIGLSSPLWLTVNGGDAYVGDAKAPRLLVGRAWFDHYPDNRRDVTDIMLFFGSGYGVHLKGTSYRETIDWFEYERSGNRIELMWLQDKKRAKTTFEIDECDDTPVEFDICVTFKQSPRGRKRYYSWDDWDDERAAALVNELSRPSVLMNGSRREKP